MPERPRKSSFCSVLIEYDLISKLRETWKMQERKIFSLLISNIVFSYFSLFRSLQQTPKHSSSYTFSTKSMVGSFLTSLFTDHDILREKVPKMVFGYLLFSFVSVGKFYYTYKPAI